MKNNKEYRQDQKQFIENYKGVDIYHTRKNGFEIAGYFFTYQSLEECQKVIDYRLNKDMKVNENKSLIFACIPS
ncbi:hypothetical protein [Clostridium sp.]|uniref:hypothetical protein n=1 Tax=Clostridium sp. TaxID=1506 RepID=UPI0025C2988D|nr:hypothetical protein [Clostridium sp.]